MTEEFLFCRICGLPQSPTSRKGKKENHLETCPCCGGEKGYDDLNQETTEKYRTEWLQSGGEWFEPENRPAHWSLEDQLRKISDKKTG